MSTRLPVVPFAQAVDALDSILGLAGGTMPVSLSDGRRFWHRCGVPGAGARLGRVLRFHDEQSEVEIRLGVPHRSPSAGGVHQACALWTVVEGTDQVRRAARFRPLPTMALKAGGSSRRWLIWMLEEPLSYVPLVEANRRLAYHLRAVQRNGDPDKIWFPVPGTCLREGRTRPAPVVVTRLSAESFKSRAIVGHLKDPPEVKWWEATG